MRDVASNIVPNLKVVGQRFDEISANEVNGAFFDPPRRKARRAQTSAEASAAPVNKLI